MSSKNSCKRKDDKGRDRAEKAQDKREERRVARLARRHEKRANAGGDTPADPGSEQR